MKCECEILENVELKEYNRYHLNCTCKYMAFPKDITELRNVIIYCLQHHMKYFVLGNGSNVIFDFQYYDGLIIHMPSLQGIKKIGATDIIAYSGTSLTSLAKFSIQNNLKGLQWALAIPKTLGGGIYSNCGTQEECLFDYLKEIIVLHNGKIEIIPKEKIFYGYHQSFFQQKRQYVILAAHLCLKPASKKSILPIIEKNVYKKTSTVFKNPNKDIKASDLIEESNLKNYHIGGATVSNNYANLIINTGDATSKDIIKLIQYIKKTIQENYKIDLILEQEIIK